MRNPPERQSATSLPASPHDDSAARTKRYLIMMAIRIVCFVLMVLVTPYGWYTAVFALAAIVLPYVAVVSANVSKDVDQKVSESPERALPAEARPTPDAAPTILRVQEQRSLPPHSPASDEHEQA